MTLIEQVISLTDLHRYWHTVGTPAGTAIADRIETLLSTMLQNPTNS